MGEPDMRARALELLDSAPHALVTRAVVDLLTEDHPHRALLVGALAKALGGSIEGLGYPVGMGLAPAQPDLEGAASKIIDRLLSCIAADAADTAEAPS